MSGPHQLVAAIAAGRLLLPSGDETSIAKMWDDTAADSGPWRPGDRVVIDQAGGAALLGATLALWRSGAVPVLGAGAEVGDWPADVAVWRWSDRAQLRRASSVDPSPPALIHASSGSTGPPKLARRSFESLRVEARRYVACYGFAAGQRGCVAAPIDHSFAFGAMLGLLAAGASVGLLPSLHPRALARALRDDDTDIVILTPAMARLAIEAAGRDAAPATPTSRLVIAGAGAVPDALDADFRSAFGCGLARNYGCSETGATFGSRMSLPEFCLGFAFDGVTIVSPQSGTGELVLDLGHAIAGIEGQPRARELRNGIWRSGDFAFRTTDGSVALRGRIDDRVKINGHLIDCGQLAARARTIAGVVDAVALAQPRPGRAEIQDLILFCEAADGSGPQIAAAVAPIAGAVPVVVLTLPELPRTPAGKPDHDGLRRLARARLGRRPIAARRLQGQSP
ncbi:MULTISPECIES: AMP-binding protein [Rhodopseudomonas]|uniref:AMP-dependent synthetase/ligase domain-containing protein n=1 Tax=Rhodopseudomonas palustris TaxID=1076 RepID=A0A0D7EDN1_RHOPL|nr:MULTISPECIES: AMP-binding protein [Rhodopseudomonas]KIZ38838.1 hypothetical protein OO17_22430 [Rhodopseudomonas palustris]WOK18376.1 AMP-binding protein [Rhodopseudomonas sp. BAL398]